MSWAEAEGDALSLQKKSGFLHWKGVDLGKVKSEMCRMVGVSWSVFSASLSLSLSLT